MKITELLEDREPHDKSARMKKEYRRLLNSIRQSIDHLNAYHLRGRTVGPYDDEATQMMHGRSAKKHETRMQKQMTAETEALAQAFKFSTKTTMPLYRGAKDFDLHTPRDRYISATADKSIAAGYSGGVLIKILPGVKALDFDKATGVKDGVQHFLFDRGQEFEVVEKNDEMITVKAI